MPESRERRRPIGAEVRAEGVRFRVWAPDHRRVEVVIEGAGPAEGPHWLEPGAGGYFAGMVEGIGPGARYRFGLERAGRLLADPSSRSQPDGPEGPSEVVDPAAFTWTDAGWRGLDLPGRVLMEIHVGTFTLEGTWLAAADRLPELAEIGIDALEIMPVAELPGRFGWGYDGASLFAPHHGYGTPDDFRRFVDRAHGLGIAVLLDVVYNHLGPRGSVLAEYARGYLSDKHQTEWGQALNFDGPGSGPVREFFLENVAYWIEEFHLDGLRIDATQEFYDEPGDHILGAIVRRAKESGRAIGRTVLVIGESEPQRAEMVRPSNRGGHGMDALWNDDFHHVAMVAATGRREAYYADYRGTAQEFVSIFKRGWLYTGQHNRRQGKSRGTPAFDLEPVRFINFLENHDQVANSLGGERIHQRTDPSTWRALTGIQLLAPGTPMLFQGQDFAASAPFVYFSDLGPDLVEPTLKGRRQHLGQAASLATPEAQALIPKPDDPGLFDRCKLDHAKRGRREEASRLHRDLIALRRSDPVLRLQGAGGLDGAVLGPRAFVVRYFGPDGDDRLLAVNLGDQRLYEPVAEPLLAPAREGDGWRLAWSSDDVRYGGPGTPEPVSGRGWRLPARSALLLTPGPANATATECRDGEEHTADGDEGGSDGR